MLCTHSLWFFIKSLHLLLKYTECYFHILRLNLMHVKKPLQYGSMRRKWSCGTTSWGAVISCDITVPIGHLEAPSVSEGLLKLTHNILFFYTSTGPPLIPGWRLLLWWWRGSSQSTSSASLAFSHHIHHPQDPENSEDTVMIKLFFSTRAILTFW